MISAASTQSVTTDTIQGATNNSTMDGGRRTDTKTQTRRSTGSAIEKHRETDRQGGMKKGRE